MLKKSLLKRIFLVFSTLFILFILYLFPTNENNNNIIKDNKEAVNQTTIYLIDNMNFVSRVNVVINNKNKIEKVKEIINYLTINSASSNYIKEGFTGIIPKNTKLLSVDIDDSLVKLNFSKEFYDIDEGLEEKMISAIIYSITGIDGIDKISIYVDDSLLVEMPKSKTPMPPALDRGFGINKIYDLTSIKGSTSTTIYYLSKYKDYYYYVPVTMISNSVKDKIEIIIEELTSKTIYQTNLISYLNDAKKISYEITDDYLLIKLNSELYYDLHHNNLIETVIYSMNLSIKENYNIKSVIYLKEDTVIKSFII
ncbi:MAG: GerMN domain-containing protein [Bacilli bacterium]|nr:GerMN domain-containing protein [Bacilli bacterium]